VLQIHGGKLDQYAKVRGVKQARTAIIEAGKNDMNTILSAYNNPQTMILSIAYTYDLAAAMDFKAEVAAAIPGYEITNVDPLSLSVSCHIGPGALALTCTRKL
jgi:fatty acid-binding protein DegV